MDEIGARSLDMRGDRTRTGERKPDLGIGRTGQRAEIGRGEEADLKAELARFQSQPLIGADHPIHLGVPSVGRHEHSHQAAASSASTGDSTFVRSERWAVQRMISKVPSSVSATAVQLSTQSPVLI